MATYEIIANTASGTYGNVRCTDPSYSAARAGTGAIALQTSQTRLVGQTFNGTDYICYQNFFEFETSGLIGSIVSATLEVYIGNAGDSGTTWTMEARLHDFGPAVTTADFVPGGSLSGKTLLATLLSTSVVGSGNMNAMTDVALAANINPSGMTRIVLVSARQRTNNAPTTTSDEQHEVGQPSKNPSSERPKLTIVTNANLGTVSQSIGAFTASATGSLESSGIVDQSIGEFTVSADGTLIGSGQGVINQTLGDFTVSATVDIETFGYVDIEIEPFTVSTVTATPISADLSQSIGEFTVSAVVARDTTGDVSVSIGEFTVTASSSAGKEAAVNVTFGDFIVTACQSGPPWPSIYGIPQTPLNNTWKIQRGDDTLRSEREVGARLYRARNGGNYADVTFAIMLKSKAAHDEFERFFRDDCKAGARPFYWIDPETGGNRPWLWASPPFFRHVALEAYRVECALLREAA